LPFLNVGKVVEEMHACAEFELVFLFVYLKTVKYFRKVSIKVNQDCHTLDILKR
jgi:hypothetical protein